MSRAPSRRNGLSRETVVEAALALIEKQGLEDFSTRKLGKALGVEAMAIYHYFSSKDRLLDAVSEKLVSLIALPHPSGDWRSALETVSREYIGIARRFPNAFVLLAVRRFNSPGTLPLLEFLLATLRHAGLSPRDCAKAFRMQGYFLNGAGLALVATIAAARRSDFKLANGQFLADHPTIAEVVPFLALDQLDEIFEHGQKIILDGIADMIRAAGREAAPPPGRTAPKPAAS